MSSSEVSSAPEDFGRCQWQKAILEAAERDCGHYTGLFRELAIEAEKAGDSASTQFFSLLSAVTSLNLQPESKDQPLGPMMVINGRRTTIPDDFTDQQLDTLTQLLPNVEDSELKARIADVLWLRRRNHEVARLAIAAYLEAVELLVSADSWGHVYDRLNRAVDLAATIDRKGEAFSGVMAHLEELIDQMPSPPPFASTVLMSMLQEYKLGEPVKYADLCDKGALQHEAVGKWFEAREFWKVKARWYEIGDDDRGKRLSLINMAETYVREAEQVLQSDHPSHMVAASHIQSAIEAYRRISGTEERRRELHRLLLDYQSKSATEMKAITSEADITSFINRSIDAVNGLPLTEAMVLLALSGQPPKVAVLREQVVESANESPLMHLAMRTIVDNEGRTVARRKSMYSRDPKEVEEATIEEMYQYAVYYQSLHVAGIVEPARRQVNMEHNVRLADFIPVVSNNPFVPKGHELIYARALLAGMAGDFLVSTSLLIPELESSLRYVMGQIGITTSGLDKYGIQEDFDLNSLLPMPELTRVLDEDMIFSLRALLTERTGSNFRNAVAHGHVSHDGFFSSGSIYFWWIMMRLCFLPVVQIVESDNATENED